MMKSGSGTVGRKPGRVGKPSAALCASASVPCASVGQRLGGGGVPFITQRRKCRRIALTVSVCDTGFGGSVAMPKWLPGQMGTTPSFSPTPGRLVSKPPAPPPCGVLAM